MAIGRQVRGDQGPVTVNLPGWDATAILVPQWAGLVAQTEG